LKQKIVSNKQFWFLVNMNNHISHQIRPKVNTWYNPKFQSIDIIFQFPTIHHKLKSHMCLLTEDNKCRCGEIKNPQHYIYSCEKYSRLRYNLLHEVISITLEQHLALIGKLY